MFKKIEFRLRRRTYREAFEDWFDRGSRILWIEGVLFVAIGITEDVPNLDISRIQVWGYHHKNQKYFKTYFLDTAIFGEMLFKETITEQMKVNMFPVSRETFMIYLNIYNKIAEETNWGVRYTFSFDTVTNQLPKGFEFEFMGFKHVIKNEKDSF